MPLYIGDYRKDTSHLSTLEHGAYLLLIMAYWDNRGLPCDDARLARIAGVTDKEWATVGPALAPLFLPGWKHKRIESEIAKAKKKSEAAKESADRRWHANAYANAMPTHSVGICERDAVTITVTKDVDEVGRARDFAGELNALRAAAGDCLNPTAPALEHLAEVSRWLAGGADLKLDVLPTIAAVGKSAKRRSVNSWAYFTQAIADARERRSAPMPAASLSPANGISQHEPRKPTGVAAVARRIAGEFREQERMASAEIVQLPSGGRG